MFPPQIIDTPLLDSSLIDPALLNQQSTPLLERLGYYPASLAGLALLLGLLALLVRKRRLNIASGIALLGIVCAGLGTTAWRQFQITGLMKPYGAADPMQLHLDLAQAWLASGVVLPAAGAGFLLLAFAWLVTRPFAPYS